MEVYGTENEKREALRRFFADNGKTLVIGAVIGIGSLVSWCYWHNYHSDAMVAASAAWQQVNTELIDDAGQSQLDAAQHFSDSNDNNYGVLASLALAHHYVNKSDFATAEKQLQKALSQTHEDNLQALINLRLAHLQLQKNNVDSTLKILAAVKQQGWRALVEDTRGDALVIKGDHQAARTAYEKALKVNPSRALRALVCMKMNNLSS